MAAESAGALRPRAGSLYRVIARLMAEGWVAESRGRATRPRIPGSPRRYYALTGAGRRALGGGGARLRQAAAVAEKRLGLARARS